MELATIEGVNFLPADAVKDKRTRLVQYVSWLDKSDRVWYQPDLRAYRDYLLNERELSPTTVRNYLSTIRSRYRTLDRDNHLRDVLYAHTPLGASPSDKKALVDEVLTRIKNATDPVHSTVKVAKVQDKADSEHRWLSPAEVRRYLKAIEVCSPNVLTYWRDVSVAWIGLATGARRDEIAKLRVEHLRETLNGEPALLIRSGKGRKQRLVPYGVMIDCLEYVERWMELAGIQWGYVFRGLSSNREKVSRQNRGVSKETVNNIVSAYTFTMDDGRMIYVRPHDLRRTYAGNYFRTFGWDRIQQLSDNLGHDSIKTTIIYLGLSDASSRAPERNIYE